jgi:hypothetical protein
MRRREGTTRLVQALGVDDNGWKGNSMTYDPNNPNWNRRTEMDLDDRRIIRDTGGMSGATMAAIAVAALLFLGVIFWAFMGGERQTATTTTNPPGTTTGQRAPAPPPPATAPKQVPERAPTTPTTPPAPK